MGVAGILTALASSALSKRGVVSAPKVAPAPAPTSIDTTSGTEALDAQKAAKKKALLAQGYQSTIATSPVGDTSTATTKKSLLG